MKNIYLTLLIFCGIFLTSSLQAQFSIGLKGGFTNSTADYGDFEIPEGVSTDVNGSNFSTLFYYQINKHLKIGIEPGITRRGAACFPPIANNWNGTPFPFMDEIRVHLRYFEAPIMVTGILPFFGDKLELQANIGYSPTYLTYAHMMRQPITIEGADEPWIKDRIVLDNAQEFNRWDHGIYAGLGIAVNLGPNQLFFQSEYYQGFEHILNNFHTKSSSYDLSVGYLYKIPQKEKE